MSHRIPQNISFKGRNPHRYTNKGLLKSSDVIDDSGIVTEMPHEIESKNLLMQIPESVKKKATPRKVKDKMGRQSKTVLLT